MEQKGVRRTYAGTPAEEPYTAKIQRVEQGKAERLYKMIRDVIRNGVKELVTDELQNAVMEHGGFNSDPEAYSIIREEVEEAGDELRSMDIQLNNLWSSVRRDDKLDVDSLYDAAVRCACECIQVAAMCRKYKGR